MILSILISTFNRLKYSSLYIPQILQRVGLIEHEVLIWDNGSTDGTLDWLLENKQVYPNIRKVFAGANNIGMQSFNNLAEAARGKYILKVDNDIEVPCSFGKRLVCAFEQVKEPNLAYLGWDMQWTPGKTFANRSGMHLYKEESGKVVHLSDETSVYISYNPRKWMVNGVCRLSLRDTFLKLGGHPKGILYGVDAHVSRQARKFGYWVGFLHTADLVVHCGHDTKAYRDFKDEQMILAGALKHV